MAAVDHQAAMTRGTPPGPPARAVGPGSLEGGARRAMLAIGILLFCFMLASLLIMSKALQNSAQFDQLYSGLLIFNALGLLILVTLIAANLHSLLRQTRQKAAGARLTVRLVAMFVVLAVTPVLILYYFSLDFLHRGIDSWFDLRVEQALDDSLNLSRLALDGRMKEILKQSEKLSEEIAMTDDAMIPLEIDRFRARSGAGELTVMEKQGAIIASSSADTENFVPDSPDETVLFQVQQGNSYIGLDTTKNAGLSIRVVVNVPEPELNAGGRIIHALYPVTQKVNELADSVQSAFVQYQELSYLREQLKLSFILILTMVLLFSIFSAVWAAFYSARKLAAPIRDLAEGTKAVAKGDYHTRLLVPGNDELGFLVASFNDMTRKLASARDAARQSQNEAEAQHKYLEAVLGRLSSGVLVLDSEKRLRTANISCGEILGVEISQLTGLSLSRIGQGYPRLEKLRRRFQAHLDAGDTDWGEQVALFGAGGQQILMCRGTSIVLAREEVSVHVIVFDDITALLQGQRDAAWSEMARRLAHEIKNPLTPIQLAAERLQHKYHRASPEDREEMLHRLTTTIVNQVETMKAMVNTFSEYARPPVMAPERVDLNVLIEEVAELYKSAAPAVSIALDLKQDLPPITADPRKLRQVFNNLLNNALEAGRRAESMALSIATSRVSESAMDYIETRIRDSGEGISEDIIATLFEPYVTTRRQGTGLGLAIVKKTVEEHGGQVLANNNADSPGACLTIRLPIFDGRSAARPEPARRRNAV